MARMTRCALLLAAALLAAPVHAEELFSDDFSWLPPGKLSAPVGELNGAIQEYHYLRHRGVDVRPWYNPIVHLDSWVAGDEDGEPYIEQHQLVEERHAAFLYPLFVTGDPEWGDYTVEADVRPLSFSAMAGVVFRYHTNRHYYLFALEGGNKAKLVVRGPVEKELRVADWRVLAEAPFPYDTKQFHRLTIENDGPRIRCLIDGRLVLEASDT